MVARWVRRRISDAQICALYHRSRQIYWVNQRRWHRQCSCHFCGSSSWTRQTLQSSSKACRSRLLCRAYRRKGHTFLRTNLACCENRSKQIRDSRLFARPKRSHNELSSKSSAARRLQLAKSLYIDIAMYTSCRLGLRIPEPNSWTQEKISFKQMMETTV